MEAEAIVDADEGRVMLTKPGGGARVELINDEIDQGAIKKDVSLHDLAVSPCGGAEGNASTSRED